MKKTFRITAAPVVVSLLMIASLGRAQLNSLDELRNSAQAGDAEAQNAMGLAYKNGREVPADYAQAATWFQKAADQNNPAAAKNLGLMFAEGLGV